MLLIAILVVGVALVHGKRTSRLGRWWLTVAALGYWLLATSLGASLVSRPLVRDAGRIESRDQARGAEAVVVLGGGIVSYVSDDLALDDLLASGLRIIEGVRVYKLLENPLLIVSGGNTGRRDPPRPEAEALRRAALQLGVPQSRIVVDDRSRTTREQAVTLKRMLGERGIARFVLVTSATHLPRALAAFQAVGLAPVPSASRLRSDVDASRWNLAPDREWLTISDSALYEYVAWAYYWGRGWVKRQPV